jgi:hypothetical protein
VYSTRKKFNVAKTHQCDSAEDKNKVAPAPAPFIIGLPYSKTNKLFALCSITGYSKIMWLRFLSLCTVYGILYSYEGKKCVIFGNLVLVLNTLFLKAGTLLADISKYIHEQ